MDKDTPLQAIRTKFNQLGYDVSRQAPCPFVKGRIWKYGTHPIGKGGAHGHFPDKTSLLNYLKEIQEIRGMALDTDRELC